MAAPAPAPEPEAACPPWASLFAGDDKNVPYEKALQPHPEDDVAFYIAAYRRANAGRLPARLREDFSGTMLVRWPLVRGAAGRWPLAAGRWPLRRLPVFALLIFALVSWLSGFQVSVEWVRKLTELNGGELPAGACAYGIDFDTPTLEWGRRKHIDPLPPEVRSRLVALVRDVTEQPFSDNDGKVRAPSLTSVAWHAGGRPAGRPARPPAHLPRTAILPTAGWRPLHLCPASPRPTLAPCSDSGHSLRTHSAAAKAGRGLRKQLLPPVPQDRADDAGLLRGRPGLAQPRRHLRLRPVRRAGVRDHVVRGAGHLPDPAAAAAQRERPRGHVHLRVRAADLGPGHAGPAHPVRVVTCACVRPGVCCSGACRPLALAWQSLCGCLRVLAAQRAATDLQLVLVVGRVNFKYADGSWQRGAFEYDWRIWGLEEITALAVEAGFERTACFIDGWTEPAGAAGEVGYCHGDADGPGQSAKEALATVASSGQTFFSCYVVAYAG
eukprot:SAG22_NODE_201_length_15391_cov_7.662176_15_plen_496_part_00